MRSYTCKIRKFSFIHEYGFYASLPALLRGCLCLCIASFQISCATLPQQTYLTNTSLSGISKVAVVASANVPAVSYSQDAPNRYVVAMMFGSLLGASLEALARSGEDREHAAKINEGVDLSQIEDKMAQYFIQHLKKGGCFQTTEYVAAKNQDDHQLSVAGFDAIIKLSVREILLKRVSGDNVRLRAHVSGQMASLKSRIIVWDREEEVLSSELHLLDYYKENGLKELDALLEKAGQNLAYDFIYLK